MLKHVTVPVWVDDYNIKLCGIDCKHMLDKMHDGEFTDYCTLFGLFLFDVNRCEPCLEEAK